MDNFVAQSERRKQVRLKKRMDVDVTPQRYEGRWFHVVKDPINLKYYRFNDQEYFVFQSLDGRQTLDQVQKSFEHEFRPERLTLEDLEGFAAQLVQSGLVHHESADPGRELFDRRRKQRRLRRLATFSNILYIKLPLIDPDRLLNWLYRRTSWIFTNTFLLLSTLFVLCAVGLVIFKLQVFWDRLPAFHEFFRFRTLLYMWISLGCVKIIHEFGHGLSCKAFGGECHEMGLLLMCFSPSMFCNVSDAWTLASKWQRMLISFAGIYVELMIAAASTFVWWYTPHWPFVNNVAFCLMTLCSVSTFMFNANPLMRFDGYYILADWLEVPNLREKANRYLGRLAAEHCLGIEVAEQPYMALWRKWLFVIYTITSWIYRWVITFSILYLMTKWLKPYNMQTLSYGLAVAALISMIFWPLYRLGKSIAQRGRLPDMKSRRVRITAAVVAAIVLAFCFLPLPINSVRETGLVEIQDGFIYQVSVPDPGGTLAEQFVHDGDVVMPEQRLAKFNNPDLSARITQLENDVQNFKEQRQMIERQRRNASRDPNVQAEYRGEMAKVEGSLKGAEAKLEIEQRALKDLEVLKTDHGGTVLSAPRKGEMNKFWDKSDTGPFCKIADTNKLRVTVPVGPLEYREIRENLDHLRQTDPNHPPQLEASILVSHRSDHIYTGRVTKIPEQHDDDIPLGLTSRGGGPVAVRPSPKDNINEPIAQTYLIPVEIDDPDGTIIPGSHARVKIHLRWRSAAWWVGQKVASALDLGLW